MESAARWVLTAVRLSTRSAADTARLVAAGSRRPRGPLRIGSAKSSAKPCLVGVAASRSLLRCVDFMSSSPAVLIAEAGVLLSTVVLTVLVSRLRRTLTAAESAPAIAPPKTAPPPTSAPRRNGWTRWFSCFSPPRPPPRLSHSHTRRPSRAAPIVADLPQASREELVEVATLFAGRLPGWEGPQATDPWTLAVDADGGALKVYHAQHGPSLLFRVTATADADFAQTVALFREVDLLSQWPRRGAGGGRGDARADGIAAHALVNFPWPLPPSLIRLHARLHAGAAAAAAPRRRCSSSPPRPTAPRRRAAGARVSARGARRRRSAAPPHASRCAPTAARRLGRRSTPSSLST